MIRMAKAYDWERHCSEEVGKEIVDEIVAYVGNGTVTGKNFDVLG